MSSKADRAGLALAAAYLLLALHGLGTDIIGDDEAREAGIARDVAAGHWLWPRFNDTVLPDKPPLYHWLAALPCAITGFSETAVRLPSAVAGAALVGWTVHFGRTLLGGSAGLVAGGLLALTPALFSRARVARPDVLLAVLLAVALGTAFRAWRDHRRRDAVAALAVLGAATLAKGPIAPALFVTTMLGFLVWQRDLRAVRRLLPAPGLAVCAVLGLGWYALALAGWGPLFVREHLVGRYLGNLFGLAVTDAAATPRAFWRQPFFYALQLPAMALPWIPLAAWSLWRAQRAGGLRDARLRFLVCWALAPVVVFTPAVVKLRYYLLPALPALALIAAPAVLELARRAPRRPSRRDLLVVGGTVAGALVLVVLLASTGARFLSPTDRSQLAITLALVPGGAPTAAASAGFALGTFVVAATCRAWAVGLGLVATAQLLWLVAGAPAVDRVVAERDSLRAFAREVAARHPAPAALAVYGEELRTIVLYVGRPMAVVRRREHLAPGLLVVTTAPLYRTLAKAGLLGPPLLEAVGRIGNLAHGGVVLARVEAMSFDHRTDSLEHVAPPFRAHDARGGQPGDVPAQARVQIVRQLGHP